MITSSHIIYGWAVAKVTEKRTQPSRTLAFVLGSVLPDVPIYTFFVVHALILGTSQAVMWDELYFDSAWTPLFTLSHSLLLWPALLIVGWLLRLMWLRYAATAALIHISLDFLVHHSDAYRHFWPLSDWIFTSPLSYWEPAYYGQWVSVVDAVIIVGLLVWLRSRYASRRARLGIGAAIGLYLMSLTVPFIIF